MVLYLFFFVGMLFIAKFMKERDWNKQTMIDGIPWLQIVYDENRNTIDTFVLALERADWKNAVYLEDDVELCNDFPARVVTEINNIWHENVITFFSRRKDDLTIGTRKMPASSFLMAQCLYIPRMHAEGMIDYYRSGAFFDEHENRIDCDVFMCEYMKKKKMNYRISVPSLVEHMIWPSTVAKGRAHKRQSLTFKK